MLRYKIYATLLDAFQGYIGSSELYQEYWGNSENPAKSEEEFEQEQFQNLLDRINRVPFESEAADKGTAFNEVIDCLIENRKPREGFDFKSFPEIGKIAAAYKSYVFEFPLNICLQMKKMFEGALTQQHAEAIINTKYGDVLLYGYIDELLPNKICDIKTTNKYNAFKFRKHWQHIVYPYCLIQSGMNVCDFEYTVTDFKAIYKEEYTFVPDRDIPKLTEFVELFIEFIEINKDMITNKKIFAEDE